ncbi:hypothetical protein KUTeg_013754 [Tegillarca granosa]|uniref:Uncharacterized protein n=1 Tax=Tegillarca granosa TaxID=220873 RepID=A0ABQ9EZR5_TEGGR|nr:hypothetical protein KUTeg_013173 [Tegillarca granosa]KAJ8308880.1 hypothetical protein KUTeg_013754 [Tegillarca granosa]
MVRFVNQNFAMNFNFQSENNNADLGTGGGGGDKEVIDQDLAKKAVQAVLYQKGMHLDNGYQTESSGESSCYTSESESMESEASEGEHLDIKTNKLIIDEDGQSDIKQTLLDLEKHHKELLLKVSRLEEEKRFVEDFLKKHVKIPWHWPQHTYPYPCPCPNTNCCHTTGQTTTTMSTGTMRTQMTMGTTVEVTS